MMFWILLLILHTNNVSGQIGVIDSFDGEIQEHNARILTFQSYENMTLQVKGQSDITQSERIIFRVFIEGNLSLWQNFEPYSTYVEALLTRFFELSFNLDVPHNTTVHFAFINFYPKVVNIDLTIEILEVFTNDAKFELPILSWGLLMTMIYVRRRKAISS